MQFVASTLSFILLSGGIYSILIFLFPQACAWQPVVVALAGYVGLESLLIATGKMRNFFELVDKNQSCGKEIIFLMSVPLALTSLLKLVAGVIYSTDIPFGFILGSLWFICALQTYMSYVISSGLNLGRFFQNRVGQALLWIIAILFVVGAIQSWKIPYPPGYSVCGAYQGMLEGYDKMGVWYAVATQKSELYPKGFARLEPRADAGDGILCLIAANYQIDAVQFYKGILVLGSILLAFVVGGMICRNPLSFLAITMALLTSCITFIPPFVSSRIGMIEMLIFGMAFVVTLPYVIRYRTHSTTIWWSLVVGLVAGIAGLVRQNTGLSILAASVLIVIIFAGIRHKKIILTLTAVIAILCGNAIISTTFKGILWYRDVKLQLVTPSSAMYAHGAGFNLLGGVGGGFPPMGLTPYPNVLDMAFWDQVIAINVHNETPLAFYVDNMDMKVHDTSFKILSQYIFQHPIEFLTNIVHKTYNLLELVTQDVANGYLTKGFASVLTILGILGGLGAISTRKYLSFHTAQQNAVECVLACMIFISMTAVVPILTSPPYLHARYETSVSLFVTTVVIFYLIFFFIPFVDKKLGSRIVNY